MNRLLCTVRGCGEPLALQGRSMACEEGHSFDVAKSGYVNLLQPQDRRSSTPGDSRETVEARRRFVDAGHADGLLNALVDVAATASAPAQPRVLDVGCGEGSFLGKFLAQGAESCDGVDISVAAVELAARRFPGARWVVANADRALPYVSGSFDLVASITARRNAAEMRRVLRPGGRLVVAVPGADDLLELRETVLGRGDARNRSASVLAAFDDLFTLVTTTTVAQTSTLGAEAAADLLASTYRLGRAERAERVATFGGTVTQSRDVFVFAPKPNSD